MPQRPEPYEYELSKDSLDVLAIAVASLETVDGRKLHLFPENVLQFWVWSQFPPLSSPQPPKES
jgi:hypothetical protein